jgi:hypothetical protein
MSIYRVKAIVMLMLFGLGVNESIAQAPPAAYGPAPGTYVQQAPAPGAAIIIAPTAPPPLQAEVIIAAPSPSHVWLPGYWNWQNRWVWIPGQWALPPRPGMVWEGHRWIMHAGNRWQMHHGGWR